MNILVIPSWYPNGEDMLMGIYHKEFCEALSKRDNIKVNMLFIERERLNNPLKYLFMKKNYVIEENGYKTYVKRMLNVERINFDLQMKRYTKTLKKAFKKYLQSNPMPDVIHAEVTIPAGYAACVIGAKYNIPVVVTEHASYFADFFKGKNKKYGDYVLNQAYFTTVSKYMLKEVPNDVTRKGVIPNLVDTANFKLERKKINGLHLVSICAFRKGKRIEDLLSALKIIVDEKRSEDISLLIIGNGYLKEYYENKCHELKLDKYVHFVGRKTKKEIAEILNKSNIFVIPSAKETFCIPGIEALASGIPVVSTKCFGPEEYIDDDSGVLVSVGDITGLAKAIMDVYENIDKYDVAYLRKKAEKYNSLHVTDTALKIYKEVIKEKKEEVANYEYNKLCFKRKFKKL